MLFAALCRHKTTCPKFIKHCIDMTMMQCQGARNALRIALTLPGNSVRMPEISTGFSLSGCVRDFHPIVIVHDGHTKKLPWGCWQYQKAYKKLPRASGTRGRADIHMTAALAKHGSCSETAQMKRLAH